MSEVPFVQLLRQAVNQWGLIPTGNVTTLYVSILLLNSNGSEHTTLKRARRFVANGVADWINESTIRFRSEAQKRDRARQIQRQSIEAAGLLADRAIHAERLKLNHIRKLPVTNPHELIAPSPRKYFGFTAAVDRRTNHIPGPFGEQRVSELRKLRATALKAAAARMPAAKVARSS